MFYCSFHVSVVVYFC